MENSFELVMDVLSEAPDDIWSKLTPYAFIGSDANGVVEQIDVVSNRIVVLKCQNKNLALFAYDDGDEGCDSRTVLVVDDLSKLIGKTIKSIKHQNCETVNTEINCGWTERNKYHTYKFEFTEETNDDVTIVVHNNSNGFYDGSLAVYLCNK